jgi:hypothetical protein
MQNDALPAAGPGGSCAKEYSQPISVLTTRLVIAILKRGGKVA